MSNDFIDVRTRKLSISAKLRKELIKHDQDCTKKNIPFCYRCAKLAYEDKIQSITREALRKSGDIKPSDLKLPKLDLKEFTGKACFKEGDESEAWEKVKGTGEEKHIGYHIDYKCNIRGCGRSIFMTTKEYNTFRGIKEIIA